MRCTPIARSGRPPLGKPAAADPAADPPAQPAADSQPQDRREMLQQALLAMQRGSFDFELAERAELQREGNALRDLALTQMKLDDEAVKKYIELI